MLGLYFGFGSSLIKFDLKTLSVIMIPTAAIIVISEIIRSIFLAEKSMLSKVLTTIAMILIDLTLYMNVNQLTTYSTFVNIISFSLFASIAGNLLWNYTSKRFGYKPAIVFRLIMTLYEFIIPIIPKGIQQNIVTNIDSTNHVFGIGVGGVFVTVGSGGVAYIKLCSSGNSFACFHSVRPSRHTNVSALRFLLDNSSSENGPSFCE
jgi:hypothetical protein